MSEKVVNDLLGYNLKIVQDTKMFSFSLDSVLLADFITLKKKVKKVVDFGTNNAAIPLILMDKYPHLLIDAVEIQLEACKIARENVIINGFEKNINIINDDIYDYAQKNRDKKVDLVVCNPPFFKVTNVDNLNQNEHLSIARHEIKINLEQIIEAGSKILDNKGLFYMVHRPERLPEIITLTNKYHLAIKRMQFVHAKKQKEANIVLIEAMYQGNSGLRVLPPIIAHDDSGEYSESIKKIFRR